MRKSLKLKQEAQTLSLALSWMKVRQVAKGMPMGAANVCTLGMTADLCFCATEDIPSDAEAEARLQNVENPEPLPIDIRKQHNLEQANRIGTVSCKPETVCHFVRR